MEYRNFDRQYRLTLGKSGGTGIEIGAGEHPLHIAFSLQKTDLEAQNTGRVTIWNLSDDHLAMLEEKDCFLSLRAGYGGNLPLIFSGIVSFASTSSDGADRKTEIEAVDTLAEVRDAYVSTAYQGTVSWRKIMDDAAEAMSLVPSYSYNAEFCDIAGGYSYVGMARDILSKGCGCCGLTWSIQNGVIQIKKPGDVMSREAYVLSPDSGLIGSPVKVAVEEDEENGGKVFGWDVTFFLNGAVNIDDCVRLDSKYASGVFRVYSLEISGDNYSGDWICGARLLEIQ